MNMRIIKTIAFFAMTLVLPSIVNHADAQIIKGEAILGMNLSQVDGDEVYGFKKPGLHVGFGGLVPIGIFDASMEILFNQKGSREKQQYIFDTLTGEYNLRLNYVEIPIMLYINDKDKASAGLGFSYARLVGVKEFEHGYRTATTVFNDVYSRNDWSILFDLKLKIWEGLKANLRYEYSLVPIRTREFIPIWGSTDITVRQQYNNMWTLRLIYIFNEERSRTNVELNKKR